MRFPFTLMGVLSLLFGIWIVVYAAGQRGRDGFTTGAAALAGAALIGFGIYRLVLSARRGNQA